MNINIDMKKKMGRCKIECGTEELIDLTENLWQKLNNFHKSKSIYYPSFFDELTFSKRKQDLLDKSKAGKIKIDLVKTTESHIIGYCISTIDENKNGEVDSIYVDENYRSFGFGRKLMSNAINWMNDNSVASKTLAVAFGNDDVIEFYKSLGFYPLCTILKEK